MDGGNPGVIISKRRTIPESLVFWGTGAPPLGEKAPLGARPAVISSRGRQGSGGGFWRPLREVAACVLGGGQGTRLGFDGPKGTLELLPGGEVRLNLAAPGQAAANDFETEIRSWDEALS